MSGETSERFLSVDGRGKRVVKTAFDENIKKRNLLVLFKFKRELNVLVPAIEIRKELKSGSANANDNDNTNANANANADANATATTTATATAKAKA